MAIDRAGGDYGRVTDFDALVEELAIAHRRKEALRRLMAAGSLATPAVRRGLRHDAAEVRMHCCVILDHFLDEAALPELMENLDHPNAWVRAWAVHALACDRCKEGSCRPGEGDSVPIVIAMLLHDPAREVRAQAVHLLGPAVHRRADAVDALLFAHEHDEDPAVRKFAGWWVPGGPRFERTRPRAERTPRPAV